MTTKTVMPTLTEHDDPIGPHKLLLVREPSVEMYGIVVVDNVAAGPAIGGVRMSPTVSVDEVSRLARAMTLKSAMAGLPHGGAKGGIVADPHSDPAAKERIVRAYARAIATMTDYIPGPDMGTDEAAMAWVLDEIGRAVGLPSVLGGIPLDEIGATAFGLVAAAAAVGEVTGLALPRARVVIQGFGAVGRHAARFFSEQGAVIVACADSRGAIAASDGLDVDRLIEHKQSSGTVAGFGPARPVSPDELVAVPCDIWMPAATADVITEANAGLLDAQVVLPGANLAVTAGAEAVLHERGILSIPDFVANAGGLLCAAVEYRHGSKGEAFALIDETVHSNIVEVLTTAKEAGITPRAAAEMISHRRVALASSYRRS